MAQQELEIRIAATLSADSITITSAQVNALIEQTSAAIAQGEADAAEAREIAFDPARSPDPKAARERMEDELFKISRLKTLQPRLETFAGQLRVKELVSAYAATRDALQTEADTLQEHLLQTYSECSTKIVAAFQQAAAFQARVRRDLPPVPPNVEPFRPFDPSTVRLLQDVILVALDGKQNIWPMQSSGTFASEFAQSMIVPSDGPRWADPDVMARKRANAEKSGREIAASFQRMSAEQEERVNAESRAATMRRAS